MHNELQQILSSFNPISLAEMDAVKLLNRTDTKFVLGKNQFIQLLPELGNHYQVLEIDTLRSANYKSLYFDTNNFDFYLHHHNGRPNRYKVRIRKYLDSDLCFFEIKHKVKGRTNKTRIKIHDFQEELHGKTKRFLDETLPNETIVSKSIWNNFERVTLVNNERKERLTFDIGLNFSDGTDSFGYSDIVIAEVKQENADRNAPCIQLFKKHQIRQARISKYCIGMGLLYPELKSNRFKAKYLMIDKIRKNDN